MWVIFEFLGLFMKEKTHLILYFFPGDAVSINKGGNISSSKENIQIDEITEAIIRK